MDMICPFCKKLTHEKIILSCSREKDKGITSEIIDGKLFYYKCTYCGTELNFVHPLIYIDDKNKGAIMFLPNYEKAAVPLKKNDERFSKLRFYKKRLITKHDKLKEKVLIFENGLNDKVIERIKLSIYNRLADDVKAVFDKMFFCMNDTDAKRISFVILLKGKAPIYYSVNKRAYDYSVTLLKRDKLYKESEYLFVNIDMDWMKKSIKHKQKKKGKILTDKPFNTVAFRTIKNTETDTETKNEG